MLNVSGLAAFAQHHRHQTHATCNQVAIADAGLIDAQAPGVSGLHLPVISRDMFTSTWRFKREIGHG